MSKSCDTGDCNVSEHMRKAVWMFDGHPQFIVVFEKQHPHHLDEVCLWSCPTWTLLILSRCRSMLRLLGYNAEVYHTGGGIMAVAVAGDGQPISEYRLIIGNECNWGADCYDAEGEYTHSVDLPEITETDSTEQVVVTLVNALIMRLQCAVCAALDPEGTTPCKSLLSSKPIGTAHI